MNGDISQYGVTAGGFVVKPLTAILSDTFARAQSLFGDDVDLRSTSVLRKILELAALEQATAWMSLDDAYDSGFTASAIGDALDQIGSDLGLARASLFAAGTATFTLGSSAPTERTFTLPIGTIVETPDTPPIRFALQAPLTLVKHNPPTGSESADGSVQALVAGPSGNIGAGRTMALNATYAARYLAFDPSLVTAKNANALSGGELFADDASYRRALYSLPRTVWTAEAVRAVILALDGVRDVLVYDPYGSLDSAAPAFAQDCFSEASFQTARDVCSPYFFTITVAPNPGVLWQGDGTIGGVCDEIVAAIAPIRPASIFPTIAQADSVEVAFRATIVVEVGVDTGSVASAIVAAYGQYIDSLRLGDAVLAAQVTRLVTEISGVDDVRDLRLRRCPPRFSEIVCGAPAKFGDDSDVAAYELGCGENVTLASREIAVVPANNAALAIGFSTS
jgi:uncharacterized phage protein gp47/JayE